MNKKLAISIAALLLASGCGGGLGSSPSNDKVLQARWDENIAQMAQVQSAIDKCAESNNGVRHDRCDSLVLLTSGDFLPRTYTLTASRFESAAPVIQHNSAYLVLVGNEEAGNCTVWIWQAALGWGWGYIPHGGDHCDRAISPRIVWSEALSFSARTRSAIEECSKKYVGRLAGNCDSFSALNGGNGFGRASIYIATTRVSSVTIAAGTAAVVLTGAEEANWCVVTITPTVTEKGVTWACTIGRSDKTPVGEKCDLATTGLGT